MNLPPAPIKNMSWRVHLTILDYIVIVTGLLFSPPLLSIGLIGICVVGILDFPKIINPKWVDGIKNGLSDPFNWAVMTLYLILLLGIWQTEDWSYYTERLRVKSALLAVPIGWWGLPKLNKQQRHFCMTYFSLLVAVVALIVSINYFIHFEVINQALKEGRALPVPRNHIRFSLLVALATITALALLRSQAWGKKWLWLCLALFLFIFQHLLAVRSGLLCAYLGIAGMLFTYLWQSKRWKVGLLGLAGLFLVPLLAYFTVPSLKTKIDYARYEIWRQSQGLESQSYSDAGRLTSIRFGLELWREHPWVGVGPGNLRQAMDQRYAEVLPHAEAKRPHNQFVSVLAGSGYLGFIPFILAIAYLFFGKKRWQSPVFTACFLILIASCMVENTLENSAGLGMFCFFLFFYRPQ